ncbi:hypothetical protein ABT213_06150 [Streptomyces sp. NPDC001674]|uniref:hypothetical protein n=1 Tax=Streptomyces sp. NPDC001674 TaxID=3154394 RepID=UPI00332BBB75
MTFENPVMDPMKALWLGTNVPAKYRTFSEDKVKISDDAVREIDSWFEELPERQKKKTDGVAEHPDYGQSLFISGDYHVGKTRFMIACVAEECLKSRKRFRWTEAVDYLDAQKVLMDIDDGGAPELHTAMQAIENARTAYFLVLDEVGEERYSDWVDDSLLRLLRGRFKNGRPTVIITQLDKPEWLSIYSRPLTAFVEKNCRRIAL